VAAVFVAAVVATIADPNGPIGIAAFGVAAIALLYLLARPVQRALDSMKNTSLHRSSLLLPTRHSAVERVARPRTVAAVLAAMSVLFTVWLTADLSRPLVYACWWSFSLLGACLLTIGLWTANRRLRRAR
jgi:hypothetical protein